MSIFAGNACTTIDSDITLEVTISGIKKEVGEIRIALYDKDNEFLSEKDINDYRVVPVDGTSVKCKFQVKEAGNYAMALVHDINSNGTMDFNLVGWPKEPYAFSNNPGVWLRAPTFEECAIKVNGNESIVINMK